MATPQRQAFVYRIYSACGDRVYIGSTIQKVNQRYKCHRYYWKQKVCGKRKDYKMMSGWLFDEYGISNCRWEVLETCGEADRFYREQHWMNHYHETKVNKTPAVGRNWSRPKEIKPID
jgi:hypothetical protein